MKNLLVTLFVFIALTVTQTFAYEARQFSADTKMCDNLIKIIERSNYGFIEMASSTPSKTHISIDEFIELSKKYPSTKMYPVHTNDHTQEYAENNGLNALYDGQVLNLE